MGVGLLLCLPFHPVHQRIIFNCNESLGPDYRIHLAPPKSMPSPAGQDVVEATHKGQIRDFLIDPGDFQDDEAVLREFLREGNGNGPGSTVIQHHPATGAFILREWSLW